MSTGVVRKWCATVRRDDLDAWVETYRSRVLENVRKVAGFRNVTFLAQRDTDPCKVTVLMEWDGMDSIRGFAGDAPAKAVIPDFMKDFFVQADPSAEFHDILLQEAHS